MSALKRWTSAFRLIYGTLSVLKNKYFVTVVKMLNELNYAYGHPMSSGDIKSSPEDFCVEENLGFELAGEGEHLCLLIEKKRLNTEEMAKIIARTLGLPLKSISYAGLKDKFAKTTQWFSLHLPGIDNPILDGLNTDNYRLLKAIRHNKKLKIGALKENHFIIKVQHSNYDEKELFSRIENIKAHGVPNYFGPQRFGHNSANLDRAKEILLENKKIKNRHLRGIYYSAARSFLFNQILSLRVKKQNWNYPLSGDLMMLVGSHSIFPISDVDDEILKRVRENDVSPAAPLWGEGKELLTGEAMQIQNQAIEPWQGWCEALERHGLQKSYRSMVLVPENLQLHDDVFTFTLPTGAYATTVLRELLSSNAIS